MLKKIQSKIEQFAKYCRKNPIYCAFGILIIYILFEKINERFGRGSASADFTISAEDRTQSYLKVILLFSPEKLVEDRKKLMQGELDTRYKEPLSFENRKQLITAIDNQLATKNYNMSSLESIDNMVGANNNNNNNNSGNNNSGNNNNNNNNSGNNNSGSNSNQFQNMSKKDKQMIIIVVVVVFMMMMMMMMMRRRQPQPRLRYY